MKRENGKLIKTHYYYLLQKSFLMVVDVLNFHLSFFFSFFSSSSVPKYIFRVYSIDWVLNGRLFHFHHCVDVFFLLIFWHPKYKHFPKLKTKTWWKCKKKIHSEQPNESEWWIENSTSLFVDTVIVRTLWIHFYVDGFAHAKYELLLLEQKNSLLSIEQRKKKENMYIHSQTHFYSS